VTPIEAPLFLLGGKGSKLKIFGKDGLKNITIEIEGLKSTLEMQTSIPSSTPIFSGSKM
jgi:hypothetical protein